MADFALSLLSVCCFTLAVACGVFISLYILKYVRNFLGGDSEK